MRANSVVNKFAPITIQTKHLVAIRETVLPQPSIKRESATNLRAVFIPTAIDMVND
jgi:hypothetical protein